MFQIDFSPVTGAAPIAGEPMIFHCNHYNCYLQRTILDPDYIDCRPVLTQASESVAYAQLQRLYSETAIETRSRFEIAEKLFRFCGFGVLDFSNVTEQGGVVSAPMSHYSFAWKQKFGDSNEPMAFFDAGFIAAAASVVFGKPAGYYSVQQTQCFTMGNKKAEFLLTVNRSQSIYESVGKGANPEQPAPQRELPTSINEDIIVSTLAGMEIVGNEEGLIPAFGVVLTRMYANYYNRISFEFERLLKEATGDETLGSAILTEAGHNCAFNTFGGIMKSDEWYALIYPMCQSREDWIHGIVAAVNAFGWGVWRVKELIPDRRLVLRVYNGYEANGYISMYGKSEIPKSYLATGATAGLMNLLYHIDITQKPQLTEAFYQESFNKPSFSAIQSKCRAMGDEFDEFVAER